MVAVFSDKVPQDVASITTFMQEGILIKIGQISQRCQIGQDKKGYFIIRRLRKLDNQSDRHFFGQDDQKKEKKTLRM